MLSVPKHHQVFKSRDIACSNKRVPLNMHRTPKKQNPNVDIDKVALECARFIICCEGSKGSIRKTEIIKHLKQLIENMPRNFYKQAIEKTEEILKRVYGYKLVSITDDAYIVILNKPCEKHKDFYDEDVRRLLIVTLTHIFMSGGTVTEDNMIFFLKQARLIEEGDDKKRRLLLTKVFTKQLYLELTETKQDDESINVFKWGKRAEHEIPKMLLLNKMSEALEHPPDFWKVQYKAAITQQNAQGTV